MRQHTFKAKSGFTLIEVLVISGLTVIIMLTTVSIFMTFLVNQARISDRQELKNAGENAVRQITQALREAKEIEDCTTGMTDVIEFIDQDNQSGTITRTSERLRLGSMPLTPTHLTVTSFSADCFDGQPSQHIRVRLTIENPTPKGISDGEIVQNFSTSITLRN